VKPVVCVGEKRPINRDFRNEHEQNHSGQHEEFHRVAEFFQRAVQPKNEEQQKGNERAEHQPAGREIRVRGGWIKTVVKIIDDGQKSEKGDGRAETGETEPKRLLLRRGCGFEFRQKLYQRAGDADTSDEDVNHVNRWQRERLAMPQDFTLPESGKQIVKERPETLRCENRMMPPFRERFVSPAEKPDFGCRAGEIAEIIFRPCEPRHRR
jgi:hypothetical protein